MKQRVDFFKYERSALLMSLIYPAFNIGLSKTKVFARVILISPLLMNIIKKFYTENSNQYF